MSIRIPLPIVIALVVGALIVPPVFAQFGDAWDVSDFTERRDLAAIQRVMEEYEAAFNAREIDRRMSLCLDTYHEYGFEGGYFLQVRDYRETRREVGRYWSSVRSLDYSMDVMEVTLDGPQAFLRAYTTHLAPDERHSSIVYFALVKIDGRWWIAWDSYNIIRRYD